MKKKMNAFEKWTKEDSKRGYRDIVNMDREVKVRLIDSKIDKDNKAAIRALIWVTESMFWDKKRTLVQKFISAALDGCESAMALLKQGKIPVKIHGDQWVLIELDTSYILEDNEIS